MKSSCSIAAVVLAASSAVFGGQSLVLRNGLKVEVALPNKGPYTGPAFSGQSFRFEFRVHAWTPLAVTSSERAIWFTSDYALLCWINEQSVLVCASGIDKMNENSVSVSVSGRKDFVATLYRDVSLKQFFMQVCDPPLTNCAMSQVLRITGTGVGANRISSLTFGAESTSAQLAYFRWRSGAGPASPPHDSDPPADLLDMEFENNVKVTRPAALKADSGFDKPTFAHTPTYAPGCSAGQQKSFRAGFPGVLDGSGSVALADSPGLTYKWEQVSGPNDVTWASQAGVQPTITGLQFGSYVFRLTVTDAAGQTATCQVKHGAVVTDANGVVTYPNTWLNQILGKSIRLGANPWPWFDERHKALADHFGKLQSEPSPRGYIDFWNTSEQGTIAVAKNSPAVSGTGTSFKAKFCAGGSTVAQASNILIVWYPLPGGATGRRGYNVASCQSDTALTLSGNFQQTGGTGLSYSMADDTGAGMHPLGTWMNGSTNANYYDNVLAFYALYYRSGIDDYRTYARTLADRWWTMPVVDEGRSCSDDMGSWCLPPRSRGVTGLVLRALDGRPDMWPGLQLWLDYDGEIAVRKIPNLLFDIREEAATLNELSLGALSDPVPAVKARYQEWVARLVANKWAVQQQQPKKNWTSPVWGYSSWNGQEGSVAVKEGSTVVTGVGTKWDCTRSDLWQPANHLWTTTNPNDQYHGDEIDYAVKCVDAQTLSISPAYRGASGSGRGWVLGSFTGVGSQPFMIGYVGNAMSRAYEALKLNHAEAAAQARQFTIDAVNWVRNPDYGGYRKNWKGLWYARGFIGCEPDPTQRLNCMAGDASENNVVNTRYLAAETMHAFAAAYSYSHDPGILASGDEIYGGLYGNQGGPAGTTDGMDLYDFLCDSCWDVSHDKAKTFGFAFGWGNGSAWPAARTEAAPQVKPVQ